MDAERSPDLLQRLTELGKDRPEVTLTSILNMQIERERLDALAARLGREDRIGSYEHDGMYLWRLPSTSGATDWGQELCADLNKHVPVSLKPIPEKEELLNQLRQLAGSEDRAGWDEIDEDWDRQLELIARARVGIGRGKEDRLYAQIVALDRCAYEAFPQPVRELFKHDRAGTYWFFSPKVLRWEKDTEVGRNELLHVISEVLTRRLSDLQAVPGENGGEVIVHKAPPEVLNWNPLLERVEKMLRAPLKDPTFELDGEDTRRYLQFTNGVWDAETMSFKPCSPEIRVTNCTGWAWKGSGLTEEVENAVHEALENVKRDAVAQSGLSESTCRSLEALCPAVPDLAYIKSVCGTWERAIYALKHVTRATFALKYQDVLWGRGPGGNGKDVLANRVATLLGSYFVNLACEALTNPTDPDPRGLDGGAR